MAKVVQFPMKKKLPKGIEDDLHRIAKEYTETLFAALMLCNLDDEYELDEVFELIEETYAEGLYKAVTELELEL